MFPIKQPQWLTIHKLCICLFFILPNHIISVEHHR